MLKTTLLLTVSFLLVIAVISQAGAVPPPDNTSTDGADNLQDSIYAIMSDVDDIGLVLIWNGDNEIQRAAYCEWQVNQHGAATVKLDGKHLNKGTNYVMFVLYNQIFKGPFGGGKWSFDFKLKKNGETVWHKSSFVRNNSCEIKYWKVLKLDVSATGSVAISDKILKEDMRLMKKLMVELEDNLVSKAPRKTVTTGDVIGAFLTDF